MSQQITCARIALRRHGGPMQDENDCACEHCVALRELIDMVRARPTLPAPEPRMTRAEFEKLSPKEQEYWPGPVPAEHAPPPVPAFPEMPAYVAGGGPEFSGLTPAYHRFAIVLNDYHLRNLRWLMRLALHGVPPGTNLNTGDWNGEILWALEQAMLDAGITGANVYGNGEDGGWPIDGWGHRPTKVFATLRGSRPALAGRGDTSLQAAIGEALSVDGVNEDDAPERFGDVAATAWVCGYEAGQESVQIVLRASNQETSK